MTIHPKEKQAWIKDFFSYTGDTYDEVVHRFTLGIDRSWKQKILSKIPPSENILDLACGTGILTFAIANKYPESNITGVDISEGYLTVARAKALKSLSQKITFVYSPAEDFTSTEPFNAVTTSYLPKYADIPRLIQNLEKMLTPGGTILFHDFTYPTTFFLQMVFELYFKCITPIGGWWFPEWKNVLRELPEVIRRTTWVSEVTSAIKVAGFVDIQVESLTLQGAALVSARKKGRQAESLQKEP